MRIRDLNWMQLEEYLKSDDRIVLPVGSTEQHAYLSLETDNMSSGKDDLDEIAAEIDPAYDHASWSENFPWTRLPEVAIPDERKSPVEWPEEGNPKTWREALGDGSFGGLYQRPMEDENRLWEAAVQAIRERLENWDY
jgi:creatinine amidohydrolase